MKLKFQTKLVVLFLALVILVSGWLTFQNLNATEKIFKNEMKEMGFTLAKSVDEKLKIANTFETVLDDLMAERILQACEAIDLLDINKLSNDKLIKLAPKLKVDGGIYIIGPDRKIVYSDIVDYVGWRYDEGHIMDPVFNGSERTYMEAIREDLISLEMKKFGGMKLSTNGYYVQIGVNASTITELKKAFNPQVLLDEVSKHKDVVYAVMMDTKGIAYAGSELMLSEAPYTDNITLNATQNGIEGAEFYKNNTLNIEAYDVQIPYYENDSLMGSIRIGITLDRMNKVLRENMIKSIISALITCIIGIIVVLLFIKLLLKPLKNLSNQLSSISKGDFTILQDPKLLIQKDDLGVIARSVNAMRESLSTLISTLKKDAMHVEDGSNHLSSIMSETSKAIEENAHAVEALAVSASDQAHETDKVTNAVESLGEKVDESLESIKIANDRVISVNKLSTNGEKIISNLAAITNQSIERTDEVSEGISEVEKTVKNMREFMGQIKSISEQTNLLALNASIEAARAGEAGKGFAVVADEIRKLAEETNNTTKQVEVIIEEISTKTAIAGEEIKAISSVTSEQKQTLQNTLNIFSEIQSSISELVGAMDNVVAVNDAVGDSKQTISSAIETLSALTENLSATCEQISASTEEQTASVVEINALADNNKNVSNELTQSISQFKTLN